MTPDVSVIVPVYNAGRTLRGCLDSLRALHPDSPSHEILVIDNGSTDHSPEIMTAAAHVISLVEPCRGPSAARNQGVRRARGRILAFTDADCIVHPRWLIEGSSALQDDALGVAGGIVGAPPGNVVQEWMNSRRILDQRPALLHPFRPFIQTANAFYHADSVRRIGGFDERLRVGEDCDLSWRLQESEPGKVFVHWPLAEVEHNHRATAAELWRQSANNARAAAHLRRKWGSRISSKTWRTSVWEAKDLTAISVRWALGVCRGERDSLQQFDLLHRAGRKWGMITAAVATGEWGEW